MARIWPDVAVKFIHSSVPRWGVTGGESDRPQLEKGLVPYWGKKLGTLGGQWLSSHAAERLQLLAEQGTRTAGFEHVYDASAGDGVECWFLDIGWLAWMEALVQLRTEEHQLWQGRADGQLIEQAWIQNPESARDIMRKAAGDDPAVDLLVLLYAIPMAVWVERDYRQALRLIDHLVRLDDAARNMLGVLPSMTAALCHAMGGRSETAEIILRTGSMGRYASMAEVRYQRARYIWDIPGRAGEALVLLEEVIREDAAYFCRMLSDIAWQNKDEAGRSMLGELGAKLQKEASAALTRWKHGNDSGETVNWPAGIALREVGAEPLVTILAGLTLPERAGEDVDDIMADLESIRAYVGSLPVGIPFNLDGDMNLDLLEIAVNQKKFAEARRLSTRMKRYMPQVVKIGLVNYGSRLVRQMADAGDTIERYGVGEAVHMRLKQCAGLITRASGLVEPLRELSTAMGRESAIGAGNIGSKMVAISNAWGQYCEEAVGRVRLVARAGGKIQLKRNDFCAINITALDVAGQPVVGVPIVWRVVSGPGKIREGEEETYLKDSLVISTAAGTAFLSLESMDVAGSGEVEVRVIGQKSGTRLSYSII